MTHNNNGVEFERRVADTLKKLNYKVTNQPPTPGASAWSLWKERIVSLVMEPPSWPAGLDMAVVDGDKTVLVETEVNPFGLGPIIQAGHYSDYFKAPILICVPDEAFPQIHEDIREWAEDNGIAISPLANIGDRIKILLEGEQSSHAARPRQ